MTLQTLQETKAKQGTQDIGRKQEAVTGQRQRPVKAKHETRQTKSTQTPSTREYGYPSFQTATKPSPTTAETTKHKLWKHGGKTRMERQVIKEMNEFSTASKETTKRKSFIHRKRGQDK